ncbi:MAG: AAA domain-containing protein [Novipirellula sp. JB048]
MMPNKMNQQDETVSTAPLAGQAEFPIARFDSQLGLPDGDPQLLKDAAAAVRQEYRESSRWKRLRCHKVSLFSERDRGTIFVVHVARSVEFDWTWEGAKAFCPKSLDEDSSYSDRCYEEAAYDEAMVWSGEIVEVDEGAGWLFITLDNPEAPPTVGSFFVRPFEFLGVLESVYSGDAHEQLRASLPSRLAATMGAIHPTVESPRAAGIPALIQWWGHRWSTLWGPPGTGKTWTTGQQIARVLEGSEERILVVSTTNRATDAVALSIGHAATVHHPELLSEDSLQRIGKGASYQTFVSRDLDSMLRGTESQILARIDELAARLPRFDSWEEKALTRKQIGELRSSGNDRSQQIFLDPDKRVVIATAFKAMTFLRDETVRKMIELGEAPFTTIFIDEAGLLSRATVAALSLLAANRVVLVGDSKQLAPISRISRILPTRQQQWLASSGLNHLDEIVTTPPAVHVLSEQWRMHPDVCHVVSEFQYAGFLTTAADRARQSSNVSPFLADMSRTLWYVLDDEEADLAAIRASRGPGNQSWVRSVTPNILKKLFSEESVRNANGLFLAPFKAQAIEIARLLADWDIPHWEASTVHSQQGSEADIVVFDTVNASNYTWPHQEWMRLVNVALSRAREAVVVLASRSEMEEPYLKPLRANLKPAILVKEHGQIVWRDAGSPRQTTSNAVAEPQARYTPFQHPSRMTNDSAVATTTAKTTHRMGDQFAQRRALKPILSQEQQRLTNLELDGKPRLVRGVAGSGKSVVLCNWLARTAQRLAAKSEAKPNGSKDPCRRIWAVYANRSLHRLLRESVESAWNALYDGELFERPNFPWQHVELMHVKDVLAGMLPAADLSIDSFGFDYDRAAEAFLNRQDATDLLPRCSALFIDEAQDMGPSTLRLLLAIVERADHEDENSRSAHIFYDNAQNVYGTKTPKWSSFGLDMRGRSTIMRESFRSTTPITELAVNVLDRLAHSEERKHQQELLSLGLLERVNRDGEEWLSVKFNQINGPKPIYHQFEDRLSEIKTIARHLRHLIEVDGISPNDICLIFNGRAQGYLQSSLAPRLNEFGVELSVQKNRAFERQPNTLVATTPHSFKGYESEVVLIPGVDCFVAPQAKVLANSLYVAMTRARSLLGIYGVSGGSEASRKIDNVVETCISIQNRLTIDRPC